MYAIADVRKALEEARAYGIIPLSFSFAYPQDRMSLMALWGNDVTFIESPKQLAKGLARALQKYTEE